MPVEKSHIMMFARSIGDANPKYYEEKDENVIAPPTFIQSSAQFDPDYFLRPKIGGDNWFGSGKEATGMKSSGSGSGGEVPGSDAKNPASDSIYTYSRSTAPAAVMLSKFITTTNISMSKKVAQERTARVVPPRSRRRVQWRRCDSAVATV